MSALRDRIHAAAARFADDIATAIELQAGGTEWVDQNDSPLGKRRHLEACRRGDISSHKEGKRVLAKRVDIDAFIKSRPSASSTDVTTTDEVDDILAKAGLPAHRRAG